MKYLFTKLSVLGIVVYVLLALNNVVKSLTTEIGFGLVCAVIFIGLIEDNK